MISAKIDQSIFFFQKKLKKKYNSKKENSRSWIWNYKSFNGYWKHVTDHILCINVKMMALAICLIQCSYLGVKKKKKVYTLNKLKHLFIINLNDFIRS